MLAPLIHLSQNQRHFKAASKVPKWKDTMKEEIDALYLEYTSLFSFPHNKNLVGCKWVYNVKKNADAFVARYKVRLVARGYSQEEGVDYVEIFNPMTKPITIRLILALATQFKSQLKQLDLKKKKLLTWFSSERSIYGAASRFSKFTISIQLCL